jgi:spermidine/putrescine transport system permease protein
MFTPAAVIIGLVYILLPFMVMPLYSSIEKLDKPCWKRRRISVPASCRPFCVLLFR